VIEIPYTGAEGQGGKRNDEREALNDEGKDNAAASSIIVYASYLLSPSFYVHHTRLK
jgi:hypothetical protein